MITSTWPAIVCPSSMPETESATPLRTVKGISRMVAGARPLLASMRRTCGPSGRCSVVNWNRSGGCETLNGSVAPAR
jgi:hypothetical protein